MILRIFLFFWVKWQFDTLLGQQRGASLKFLKLQKTPLFMIYIFAVIKIYGGFSSILRNLRRFKWKFQILFLYACYLCRWWNSFACKGAARNLLALCQQIGSDLTALHVLPKLRKLFDELAFSQEKAGHSSIQGGIRGPSTKGEDENKITSRLDLVWVILIFGICCHLIISSVM